MDRPTLLRTILQLQTIESLPSLRDSVSQMRQELNRDGEVLGGPSNGDVVRVNRKYVSEELQQIAESHTLERARYYLQRLQRGVTQSRTSGVNDINLNRWKEYDDILTDSLWILKRRDNSGVHTAGYWGNFVPQIPHQMIRRYTKPGEWVLDPFLGSGTTLIEVQRLGRNGVGVELQPAVLEKARACIQAEPNPHRVSIHLQGGDSAAVDFGKLLPKRSVQLLMMHPPYFDIIKFSDDKRDLSNAASVDGFLEMLLQVVRNTSPLLDKGRYLALVIGDKYADGEWIPLGFRAMDAIMQAGFSLKSIIVKNFEDTTGKRNQKELWKYRALVGGFYIFKHEYVFVFRKR